MNHQYFNCTVSTVLIHIYFRISLSQGRYMLIIFKEFCFATFNNRIMNVVDSCLTIRRQNAFLEILWTLRIRRSKLTVLFCFSRAGSPPFELMFLFLQGQDSKKSPPFKYYLLAYKLWLLGVIFKTGITSKTFKKQLFRWEQEFQCLMH